MSTSMGQERTDVAAAKAKELFSDLRDTPEVVPATDADAVEPD